MDTRWEKHLVKHYDPQGIPDNRDTDIYGTQLQRPLQ